MKEPYLEVTFHRGRVLAAYYYLPRKAGQRSFRTRQVEPGLVIDFARGGQPIGVEITAPTRFRYYVEVLGFTQAAWGGDDFTCVTRDNAGIYLSQWDQGHPGTWVWIGVDDVEALPSSQRAASCGLGSRVPCEGPRRGLDRVCRA